MYKQDNRPKNKRTHTDWLRNQLWQDIFLVVLRNGRDDGRQRRLVAQAMLFCHLTPEFVEVDIPLGLRWVFLRFIFLYQSIRNIRARPHKSFIFWWQLGILRLDRWRGGHGRGCHNGWLPRANAEVG